MKETQLAAGREGRQDLVVVSTLRISRVRSLGDELAARARDRAPSSPNISSWSRTAFNGSLSREAR
jgi:hypothetical protein